jgi:hypothetical protein
MMFVVLLPYVSAEPMAVPTRSGALPAISWAACPAEPNKRELILFPVASSVYDEYELLVSVATLRASSKAPPTLYVLAFRAIHWLKFSFGSFRPYLEPLSTGVEDI